MVVSLECCPDVHLVGLKVIVSLEVAVVSSGVAWVIKGVHVVTLVETADTTVSTGKRGLVLIQSSTPCFIRLYM